MVELKIETGVPAPRERVQGRFAIVLRLGSGESVLFPEGSYASKTSLSQSMTYYRRRYGLRLAMRTVPGGVRVWRLAGTAPREEA
jgi:hypothetical protein